MILSNLEIQKALDTQRLIIEPPPLPRRPDSSGECPYGTHSVDLKLGLDISIPQKGLPIVYDPVKGSLVDVMSKLCASGALPYTLEPGSFVLGRTLERVVLPLDKDKPFLAARIEGKSSRARCGLLIHCTAPTVHPGWDGSLTLEIANLGPTAIHLQPNMYIAQLIIEEVRGEIFANPSEFQEQNAPEGRL